MRCCRSSTTCWTCRRSRRARFNSSRCPSIWSRCSRNAPALFMGSAATKGIELIVCPPTHDQPRTDRRSAAPAADPDESDRQCRQVHGAGRNRRQGRRRLHRVGSRDASACRSPTPESGWTRRRSQRSSSPSRRRTSRPPVASAAAASGLRSAASSRSCWAAPSPSTAGRRSARPSPCALPLKVGAESDSTIAGAVAAAPRAHSHASAGPGRIAGSPRARDWG